MKNLSLLILAQLVVTLALLGFAFGAHVDEQTRTLIVGAVIGHWLVESNNLGRQVATGRQDATTAVTTTSPPAPPAASPPANGG